MTTQCTAPVAVMVPRIETTTVPIRTVAQLDEDTQVVFRAAKERLLTRCSERADMMRQRHQMVSEYLAMVTTGTWLSATPAEVLARRIADVETCIRNLDCQLTGEVC